MFGLLDVWLQDVLMIAMGIGYPKAKVTTHKKASRLLHLPMQISQISKLIFYELT